MKMTQNPYVSLCLLFLLGCHKGEIPITPHSSGALETTVISIGSDYKNQIFYNLESNALVSQNEKTEWDLGFLTGPDDWQILINSSKAGGIWRVEDMDFASIPEVENAIWDFDTPNGHLDSTAIDDYRNTEKFYVVDLGYSSTAEQLGYMKLKVDSVNETGYYIRTADLEHEQVQSAFVEKNQELHRVCFSFAANDVIDIEPVSSDWDLLFSQYTSLFYNPFTPYIVTGVLINTEHVQVAVDTEKDFEEITYDDIEIFSFSSNQDAIGYDWKEYSFDTESYEVFSEINFIIKDAKNQYFKIHFIDFYNDFGEKGYPTFEIQQL